MSTSPAIGLAVAGVVFGAIGIFFFGVLALIIAFILFAMAIFVLAGEVEALRNPVPKEKPHPLRYACPGCGGDVYMGQAVCPSCGRSLAAPQTPSP